MPRDLRAEQERAESALRDAVMAIKWPPAPYPMDSWPPGQHIQYISIEWLEKQMPPWHPQITQQYMPRAIGSDFDSVLSLWKKEVEQCLVDGTGEWIFWRMEPRIYIRGESTEDNIIWDVFARFSLPVLNAS